MEPRSPAPSQLEVESRFQELELTPNDSDPDCDRGSAPIDPQG